MKIAVVRVRGVRNVPPRIRKTLELLMLHKPNHCVLVNPTPQILGMLKKARDYITYGQVKLETIIELIKRRGEKGSKKASEIYSEKEIEEIAKKIYDGGKLKDFLDPVFRLHPPRKGWKSIKKHYPKGALGERDNMDDLLMRMM